MFQKEAIIVTVDDFLLSDQGVILMDIVYMKVIAVDESVKNLDKHTGKSLLINYPEISWNFLKTHYITGLRNAKNI